MRQETACHPSQAENFFPRRGRHVCCDMNHIKRAAWSCGRYRQGETHKLHSLRGQVKEIYLDYCWSVGFYWSEKLLDHFYDKTLQFLNRILTDDGAVILPMHPQIFVKLILHEATLAPLFAIEFLNASETNLLNLVIATNQIDQKDWQDSFEKAPNQELQHHTNLPSVMSRISGEIATDKFKKRVSYVYSRLEHGKNSDYFIKMRRIPAQVRSEYDLSTVA